MKHKCMKCSKVYDNQSPALFVGCECGTRLFVLMNESRGKKQDVVQKEELAKISKKLSLNPLFVKAQRHSIAPANVSAFPMVVEIRKAGSLDDVENIKVFERGRYELDVEALMKGNPIVIKTDKEVYYVQMPVPPKMRN